MQRSLTKNRFWWAVLILALVCLCPFAPALAQTRLTPEGPVNAEQPQANNQIQVFRLSISPAEAPDPPLEHRLHLPLDLREPGNSVPWWYRSILEFGRIRQAGYFDAMNENHDAWMDGPVSSMPVEDVREFMNQLQGIVHSAHDAARQRETEWNLDVEELQGPETIEFLLSEFQEMRQLSRLLILDARVAIADGRFEDAIDDLRTNYRLSQDVQEPQLIINSLIGIAISTVGHKTVLDLIDAPDSPNMYWALASLPRPLHNMQEALSFEVRICSRIFPWLESVDQLRSNDEWRAEFRQSLRNLEAIGDSMLQFRDVPNWQLDMATTAMVLRNYSRAKDDLVAWGYDADEVEQMPVGQVIAEHGSLLIRKTSERIERWVMLADSLSNGAAVWQALEAEEDRLIADGMLGPAMHSHETLPLVGLLLPAVTQGWQATLNADGKLALLQTLEAIRMQAAVDGAWPASLDAVTIVPVPLNPVTGEPFTYTKDGNHAVLEFPSPNPSIPQNGWRLELELE